MREWQSSHPRRGQRVDGSDCRGMCNTITTAEELLATMGKIRQDDVRSPCGTEGQKPGHEKERLRGRTELQMMMMMSAAVRDDCSRTAFCSHWPEARDGERESSATCKPPLTPHSRQPPLIVPLFLSPGDCHPHPFSGPILQSIQPVVSEDGSAGVRLFAGRSHTSCMKQDFCQVTAVQLEIECMALPAILRTTLSTGSK